MTLADTSVWVDHFRRGDAALSELLAEGSVIMHPLVIEELACGALTRREEILGLLETLPKAPGMGHAEFLPFVVAHRLYGGGLGAVDVHLLASARLARARLWTRDRRLHRAAIRLGVGVHE